MLIYKEGLNKALSVKEELEGIKAFLRFVDSKEEDDGDFNNGSFEREMLLLT